LKLPPAYTSDPIVARALKLTEVVPDPTLNQALPFHTATFPTDMPPADVYVPPTQSAPPTGSSVRTLLFTPDPRADQVVPFHLATRVAAAAPAPVNVPPA
jgi:hypothetical protein